MFEERWSWIPALNVDYRLGVDGLSMTMVLLTAIVTPLALLAHWKLDRNVKLFFFLFLLLQTGMFGVFTALNFFHWFIFWELGLIPMYFLIKIWGAEDRTYASFKFFIYTLAGSVGMLLAFAFHLSGDEYLRFPGTCAQMAASGELARGHRQAGRQTSTRGPACTSARRASVRCCSGERSSGLPSRCRSGRFTRGCPMRTRRRRPAARWCWRRFC